MKFVLQRVKEAKVLVAREVVGSIGKGVLIFVAFEKGDVLANLEIAARKIQHFRMFLSTVGANMDMSCFEVDGEFLIVSQFTLAADFSKGNRPSFDKALPPEEAEKFYNSFIEQMKKSSCRVQTGRFRANMDVTLVNDGPVTFVLSFDGNVS